MTNVASLPVPQNNDAAEIMERVLLAGDLSKLSADERTRYFMATCQSLGLNPLTKPLDYIRLSGREVLYATKGCADQLRKIHRISLEITDRKISGDLMVVTVRATTPDGRVDEDMGVIPIKGLQGEALSNAMLKALTKGKRRVTLSICGLGMLDESEVRSAVEAEALAGPVDLAPRQRAIAAPAAAMPPEASPIGQAELGPRAKPPLAIRLPDGGTAEFERSEAGWREAYDFMSAGIVDGQPEVVGLNNKLLDSVARAYPAMADSVAELRAAAVMAMAPGDEPDDPDRDEFGLPPLRPADDALPNRPSGAWSEDPP
jgi:hypothetical protein